jgi:hypothetical protein
VGQGERIMAEIEPDKFKLLLDALEKASTRTRSIYYFFAIVYISITLYAANAFVFSFPQARLDEFHTWVTLCQQPKRQEDPHCANLGKSLHSTGTDARGHMVVDRAISGRTIEEKADAIADAGAKHRQDTYLDEIASSRKFTFPLVGVSVDVDYFWLMNSLIGTILYFVLISALTNEAELFGYMVDKASEDETHMRLVLSSQVLSSSSDHIREHRRGFDIALKSVLLRSVLLLPIAIGILRLFYDFHLFDAAEKHFSIESLTQAWSSVKDDYSNYPLLFIIVLAIQVSAIIIMIYGFVRVNSILAYFGSKYEAEASKLQGSPRIRSFGWFKYFKKAAKKSPGEAIGDGQK